jgi:phosphatidylserine decarboxylase
MWRLARIRQRHIKNFLITRFTALFDLDLDEVKLATPNQFASFNEFFIRELCDNARPIDDASDCLVSPVDGTMSQVGPIRRGAIIQAKSIDYTVTDLLATDLDDATAFADGSFATIYLAPHNYHRIHAPFDAELRAARYVPGDLFSVNNATATHVRGLFRRNERLVMQFQTRYGRAALVLVGALMVGAISTPWTGEIRPRRNGVVEDCDLSGASTTIVKGDLLGWFNMGSTVILLLPRGAAAWNEQLRHGTTLRMGQTIASWQSPVT